MSLFNDDTGLMNGFSMESILRDSGLESSIQKFIEGQTENVIEFELFSREETISMHSSK